MIRAALALSSVLALAETPVARAQTTDEGKVRDSVVRIVVSHRMPNLLRPWLREPPVYTAASGMIVDDRRILTNCHVVLYADQLFVIPYQSSQRLLAKVEQIAPDVDLATVRIADEQAEAAFFKTRRALKRASGLPDVQDPVNVFGYPQTGTSLSITNGTVTAIDFGLYGYAYSNGLRIQIAAALNPGNSGGHVLVRGKVVGIVGGIAGNVGYVIPNEEINAFLTDIADGAYEGKPTLFEEDLQALENVALRAKFGLANSVTGVLVRAPFRQDAAYPLKKGDVITRIGDYDIDNYGLVQVEENLRLPFGYLVPKLARADSLTLGVLRGAKPIEIELPVSRERDFLIPFLNGTYPPYFVYGPLVFSAASEELAQTVTPFLAQAGIRSPLVSRRNDRVAFEGEQLVVVTAMLQHRITAGYSDPSMQVLTEVNGVQVRNLRHLLEILRDVEGPFIEFEFAEKGVETLVFNLEELLAASEEILADNGIRNQCSDDLREVWQGK